MKFTNKFSSDLAKMESECPTEGCSGVLKIPLDVIMAGGVVVCPKCRKEAEVQVSIDERESGL